MANETLGENTWTIDKFLKNPITGEELKTEISEDVIKYYDDCPNDDLENIKKEALNAENYEVAILIREILKYRESQNNPKIPESLTEPTTNELKDTLNEYVQTNSELVNYHKTQIILAKMLYEYACNKDENSQKDTQISPTSMDIDIRDNEGNKVDVTPENINKYQTTILYKGGTIGGEPNGRRFFILKNGQFKEVTPASDKIFDNTMIDNIEKIGDYYRVTLCNIVYGNNSGVGMKDLEHAVHYVVDHNGNYVQELGPQSGDDRFEVVDERLRNGNSPCIYKYKINLENKNIIYNSKMEKLAEYNDSERFLDYCDDEFCVCCSRDVGNYQRYKVFQKNKVIKEGLKRDFKTDLEGNDLLSEYIRKRESGEESEIEKAKRCNCVINYDEDKKALTITNYDEDEEKRKILFSTGNITKRGYNYGLTQGNTEYEVTLKNHDKESKILAIEIRGNNSHKCVLVNKETGEKGPSIDLNECYCHITGNIIKLGYNNNISEVYDQNFVYLGKAIDDTMYGSREGIHGIKTEENGKIKFYIVNSVTGEKTEIKQIDTYNFYSRYDSKHELPLPDGAEKIKGDNWGPGYTSYIHEDNGNTVVSIFSDKEQKVIRQYVLNDKDKRMIYITRIREENRIRYLVFLPDGRMAEVIPPKS